MKAFFADTFFWVALTNPEDSWHHKVIELDERLSGALIVTTDEVLTEFLAFYSGDPWLRNRAAATVRRLFADPGFRVIEQSRESFLAGLRLYEARPDKGYSLADCISMFTMRAEHITEVLSNDRHFSQEGFHALFRDDQPGA